MPQFVLRFQKPGAPAPEDVERIEQLPGVEIIERMSRMVIVTASAEALQPFLDGHPDWVSVPAEPRSYRVPDPRQRLR